MKYIEIKELNVIVASNNNNPTILNPDFLKYNDIVPGDWELAEPAVCTYPVAQVRYKNGVMIGAQLQNLVFNEALADIGNARVPQIAARYVETLKHVDYRAVGINPKGHVAFDSDTHVSDFVVETFLQAGPWLDFAGARAAAVLQLSYPTVDGKFNLTVEAGSFVQPDGQVAPALVFAGNFHHDLAGTVPEKVASLAKIVGEWRSQVDHFRSHIERMLVRCEAQV